MRQPPRARRSREHVTSSPKQSPLDLQASGLFCSELRAGGAPAWGSLDGLNVRGLLALRALRHFEADLLAFLERLESAHLDCGKMREQVFAAVIRRDEAVAFRVIKPFHGTS